MIVMRANQISALAIALLCAGAPLRVALAEDSAVAIVEDTSGKVAGVEPLDLLREGKTIDLNADGGLIVSYLNSCQRESIRGGKVTIGKTQSEVEGGEVGRQRVRCDAAALNLTPEQANQSATLVFRKPEIEEGVKFVIETRQPLVIAPDLKEILVEELRDNGQKWTVKVVKGVADITAGRNTLDLAGRYQLSGGGRSLIFRVGKEATDAKLPLLQRAIRL